MSIDSLKDVYIDQLQDLYSANSQSAEVTAELASAASSSELKSALERGVAGIKDGKEKMAQLLNNHGAKVDGEFCKGMEGLVKEARAHGLKEEFGDADAQDAMIITQYQRMAHYAIAGYGCLATFANRLDLQDDKAILQTCLDACYDGDRSMSELAMAEINAAAV